MATANRTRRLQVTVTEAEEDAIKARAREYRMTLTTYLRLCGLGQLPTAGPPTGLAGEVDALRGRVARLEAALIDQSDPPG